MSNKIPVAVSALFISILLPNCSTTVPLNTVTKVTENKVTANTSPVKEATINFNTLDSKDISDIQVDDKQLSPKEYTSSGRRIKLTNLEPGRHVVKFNHTKYGSTEVPLEVVKNNENNYQFNPTIENNKINNWELGLDANNDGIIDDNSFLSRQVAGYVVVRETSGTTNYLPRQNFPQDFKKQKLYPKPEGFQYPDPKGLGQRFDSNQEKQQKPVFLANSPDNRLEPGHIIHDQKQTGPDRDLLSSRVYFPFPQKLTSYKISAILIGDHLLPESAYMKEKDSLIFKAGELRNKDNIMKVYLIDETGQGVLLTIQPKRPIFNEKNENEPSREIFIGSEDLDYSQQDNIKLDIEKIQQLKNNPENPKPPQQLPFISGRPERFINKNRFLPVNSGPKPPANPNTNAQATKYVKIDENGEIVGYSENLSPVEQQDVSLINN